MRRVSVAAMMGVGLLALSSSQSKAAFTIGDWIATPTQTVGDATWVLSATTLPTGIGVDLVSFSDLRIQNESGLLIGPASYTLDYTVSLSGGRTFTDAAVDSTTFGSSDVSKDLTWAPSGSLSIAALNGVPSGLLPISGSPTSLTAHETITIGSDSVMTAFADTYVTAIPGAGGPVPESGTTVLLMGIMMTPLLVGRIRAVLSR